MSFFGKFLALILSSLLLTINLLLIRPAYALEQYFFQEEFNQERPAGILDPDKWVVYPNRNPQPDYLGCLVDTVRETGGILLLKQCSTMNQFPYIVSKNNPIPNGDFTATVRFQFPGAGGLPTGVKFIDTAPGNGQGATELFGVGFEEDVFQRFVIKYQDSVVYTKGTDSNYYIFKAVKQGNIYKLYLNDQLVFTSPETSDTVRALYIGNPAIIPSPGYGWSWPRIDYIRVTDNGPSVTIPQPFLDLPWDYSSSGKDFKQIVFNPNSWFDHKYPLQNFNCCIQSIVDYKGEVKDKAYKSHSGYDYGSPHGVVENTPVLAAAAGKAIFIPESSSGGAGNMIKIDHGNGYQTWYEHLEKVDNDGQGEDDQLVVDETGKEVEVEKGQKIGRVGLTGNTTGYHIHLSVFKDINNNGDFNDDRPFGLVDPLGWEGDYTDPWEEYSVTDGNNITKHGAKSYKLFTGLTPPKLQQVPTSGGTVTDQKFTLNIPANASNGSLNFKIENSAFERASDLVKSIVPALLLSATTNLGQTITNFNNPLGLLYDYSKADLNNINEDTISFYAFDTNTSLWEKMNSTLDKTNKTVSSQTTHFSQFAVMAQLLDTTPPITQAELTGDKGTDNWYRSDVTIRLLPEDNPGGKGVSYSVYSLNGENWEKYENPLEFKNEGPHKIMFLSHDNADNQEEIKTVEFSIDKTPPEARIEVDSSDWDLKVTSLLGNTVKITKKLGKKHNEATYILEDPAGNTLTLGTYDSDGENKDVFKLYSFKYNLEKPISIPTNSLVTTYTFQPNPKKIRIINQSFDLKNQASFNINADSSKNRSFLSIIENRKPRKEEKEGLVLLRLKTNKGKLEYSY